MDIRTNTVSFARLAGLGLFLVLLAGCSQTTVKTTAQTPLDVSHEAIPEDQLLDVGVVIFDPNYEDADDSVIPVFPEVRRAESQFFAVQLTDALQRSAGWGAVRVVPNEQAAVDLVVSGKILQSDGEQIELHFTAIDSRGQLWLDKSYQQAASRYSYDRNTGISHDPFEGVYNQVANDLLAYRKTLTGRQLADLRLITELKFAKDFSPEAFDQHIGKNNDGFYQVNRLPADNDPMLARIRDIRERDYLFIDTLQEYYGAFAREMEDPYKEWRSLTYEEVLAVRELRQQAFNRKVAGVASIVGGVLAAGSSNGSARAAGQIGVVGGGYLFKDGLDKSTNSKLHIEALQELGDSLGADIEPHYIELEDRTITLSGSVENQYDQWREILQNIYLLETGGVVSDPQTNTN